MGSWVGSWGSEVVGKGAGWSWWWLEEKKEEEEEEGPGWWVSEWGGSGCQRL